jgi:type IV secretory pathway VirB10-like protein
MSASQDPLKAAISRKFGISIFAFLGALFALGMLWILIVGAPDPAAEAARKAEERRLEQLRQQSTVTDTAAQRILQQQEFEAQRAAEKAAREALEQTLDAPAEPEPAPAAPARPDRVMDEAFLAELDALQRELGAAPNFQTDDQIPMPEPREGGAGGGAGGASGGSGFGVYEDGDAAALSLAPADAGPVETVKPRDIPARSVHRGVTLRAALVSRIDTRNDGPLIATITRDVYDSRFVREILIPRGSRLMGTYSTSVAPGVDRIAVSFDYITLPNGKAIELPDMPAAATDGTIGIAGNYNSNLLRAIGPSFVVAALGQWVDSRVGRDLGGSSATPGDTQAPLVLAPSVMERVTPEISQAVLERYSAARPYFIADPGQEIRIIVTQEIEIPTS